MVRAIKQSVSIQPGGRLEIVSSELPEGARAEVIILLPEPASSAPDYIGLFAGEAELLDEIVSEALGNREAPLRASRG